VAEEKWQLFLYKRFKKADEPTTPTEPAA
jgi:hypothetical protein